MIRALTIIAILLPTLCQGLDPSDTDRVLVVWNSAWTVDADADGIPDAQQVKDAYVSMRAIPTNHVLAVSTLTGFDYPDHPTFYADLASPLTNALATLGATNIDVIVLIYGIPARVPAASGTISVDNALMNLYNLDPVTPSPGRVLSPYLEATPTFLSDKGHFDHATYTYAGKHIYMVCRLSAPDAPRGVLNQLMQTMYAEHYLGTNGIKGPLYLDSRWGPYTDSGLATNVDVVNGTYLQLVQGDANIAYTEHYMTNSGIELQWENLGGDWPIGHPSSAYTLATNAWFYMGWYNFRQYIDAFDWLPGSVGCDLNSDSVIGYRDGQSWGGGAFQQGLTCAAGVIGEPYLNGHARPNVLAYYLLQGYTFAEASHLATPDLEWQCVNLGDPLYAPLRTKSIMTDSNPPVFASTSPFATNINISSATIPFQIQSSFTNPEVAFATLSYGLTPACNITNTSQRGYWFWNEWTLQNLNPGSTYYYRVALRDPAGNETNSPVYSFETYPAIQVSPALATNAHILSWDSYVDQRYSLLLSTNLAEGFADLVTNLLATPPQNSYTSAVPANSKSRFYRVRIDP